MEVISVDSVSKIYQTSKISFKALTNINLKIYEGDFVALVGPSGSGKSTLLNLLGALDSPTEGDIVINDVSLSTMNRYQLAKFRLNIIGFIFQSFNLIPVLTAYENIEIPLVLRKMRAKERKRRIIEVLEIVGLQDFIRHKPTEMSGGQQQRVAIARALVDNPRIILADEPTANLDSNTGYNILKLMKEINETVKATFIFSTHDPKIMEFASRVVRMKDGQIEEDKLLTQTV